MFVTGEALWMKWIVLWFAVFVYEVIFMGLIFAFVESRPPNVEVWLFFMAIGTARLYAVSTYARVNKIVYDTVEILRDDYIADKLVSHQPWRWIFLLSALLAVVDSLAIALFIAAFIFVRSEMSGMISLYINILILSACAVVPVFTTKKVCDIVIQRTLK